jgi:hypothetical protein
MPLLYGCPVVMAVSSLSFPLVVFAVERDAGLLRETTAFYP